MTAETPGGGGLTEAECEQIEEALDGGRMYDDVPAVVASIKSDAMRAAVDQVRPVPREFVRVEDMHAAIAAAAVRARAEVVARVEAALFASGSNDGHVVRGLVRAALAAAVGGDTDV